jgi:transposase
MANYRSDNYQQTCFVAVNLEEQLVPGTFEHALHYLIEHYLDLSDFDADYKNDDAGRPAYHPGVMLRIVLFAYSRGIHTSRQIAWHCQRNITFMALACHEVPHWTTIANFVSTHPDAITNLFERVLLVCDQQGLLGHELIAIDGCKMPSNASKSHAGTFAELDKKRTKIRARLEHALTEHQRFDAANDEQAADRAAQRANTLKVAAERIDDFLETQSPRMGQGKKPKEVKSNITDNESATMKTSHGVIQGYNGVSAVDRKHQIIVNAEIYGAGPDRLGADNRHSFQCSMVFRIASNDWVLPTTYSVRILSLLLTLVLLMKRICSIAMTTTLTPTSLTISFARAILDSRITLRHHRANVLKRTNPPSRPVHFSTTPLR